MSNDNELSSKVQTGAIGWMRILAAFVLIAGLAYVGFVQYRLFMAQRDLTQVKNELTSVTQSVNDLKAQSVEEVFIARKTLDVIEQRQVIWSNVIKSLNEVTPSSVLYRSYSGSESGEIILSAIAPSFTHVANAIRILGDSDAFYDVFVPAVSKGVMNDDSTLVTFGMKLKYNNPVSQ